LEESKDGPFAGAVNSAKFITSLSGKPYRFEGRGKPEIAVIGRSNVGKSSLINCLTGMNRLAMTSATPGRTRLINVFEINASYFIMDLPGYGYARVPRGEKERWAQMIESYLRESHNIRLALLIVDIRHVPTAADALTASYLRHYQIPFIVAATKADKLSRAARARGVPAICRALSVQPWDVFPFSSVDSFGRENLLEKMGTAVNRQPPQ
jgi:GTP-binding protein